MPEVHEAKYKEFAGGYQVNLLVRLTNGKLRSFTGMGGTPMAAFEDALAQAVEADGR